MGLIEAAFLGLLQGIAEFLPISSSGHLVIAQNFLGINEPGILLDVFLHFGTLLSIIVVFRTEILEIFKSFYGFIVRRKLNDEERFASKLGLLIIIGTIPAVIVGFFFKDIFEKLFENTRFVGIALIFTSILLFFGNRLILQIKELSGRKEVKDITIIDSILIGAWQAFAILPGISRSGSTIVGALTRKIEPESAARFSLLLSLPAVLGANLVEAKDMTTNSINFFPILLGAFIAFIAGIFAIKLLINLTMNRKLNFFAWYCLTIGILTLIF